MKAEFASEAVERPTEPGAAFVVLRLVGGFLALSGGSALGLLLSGEPCLSTAREGAWWAWCGGAMTLAGLVLAIGAWWPKRALQLGVAILLVGMASAPLAGAVAARFERGKLARTMGDIRTLATTFNLYRDATGTFPAKRRSFAQVLEEVEARVDWPKPLPRADAWGGTFRYEFDGVRYSLLAPCRCGLFDAPKLSDYDSGTIEDPRSDILFVSDSGFTRFPPGTAGPDRPAVSPPPR